MRRGLVGICALSLCVAGLPGIAGQTAAMDAAAIASAAQANGRKQHDMERGIQCARIVRGNPNRREIALTFDDGPHGAVTDELLDILRRENVKATFFVVGRMVDRFPELVRKEAAEGHEIANHTYNHQRLPNLPPAMIQSELLEGAQAIERAIGSPARLYRPPGGEYNPEVLEIGKRLGYVLALWTDDPGDFAQPGSDVIEERLLDHVENGAIVLLHDGIRQTLAILPDLIHQLKQQGYTFVTVSEMARQRGAMTSGGPIVRARKPLLKGGVDTLASSVAPDVLGRSSSITAAIRFRAQSTITKGKHR